MGFRKDAWASVWSVEDGKNGSKRVRLSTSHKNTKTGEYEQDFSGFCTFFGTAATKAANLKEKDRIKLGDVDVTTWYDSVKQKEFVFYKVFDYEPSQGGKAVKKPEITKSADIAPDAMSPAQGEIDEDELPF